MKGFVSNMRNDIINTAIESLRTEGLKFSVDTIASKLKISKKTIYKFFPDKEALAYAIYERYYKDASDKVKEIEKSGGDIKNRLFMVYYDACFMIRKEIFNKYKLNDSVYAYAVKQHNELWSQIIPFAAPSASQTEGDAVKTIIEGAFEKAAESSVSVKLIIGKLVKML